MALVAEPWIASCNACASLIGHDSTRTGLQFAWTGAGSHHRRRGQQSEYSPVLLCAGCGAHGAPVAPGGAGRTPGDDRPSRPKSAPAGPDPQPADDVARAELAAASAVGL